MKNYLVILLTLVSSFCFSQGNITGARVQANTNLLPPLDTILNPYRVGEIRTKVSGSDTLVFVAVSTSAPRKWAFLKASALPQVGTTYTFNSPLSLAGSAVSLTTVPVNLGGTGATSYTANQILYGNGTSPVASSSSLIYNPSTNRMQIGATASGNSLTITSSASDGFINFYEPGLTNIGSIGYSGSAFIQQASGSRHYQIRGSTTAAYGLQFTVFNTTGQMYFDDNSGNQFINITPGTTGSVILNEGGVARNLRVESDNDANMLFVNGATDRIGIGTASPTAKLHLPAGAATANTAPLKLTAGTILATAESGVLEVDGGNNLFYTNGTAVRGRLQQNRTLTSSAASLSLTDNYNHYVFDGVTSTWTLPAVSGTANVIYYIKNRGSGVLTINTTSGNEIYDTAPVNTLAVSAGSALVLFSDGTYYNVE